MSKFFVALLVSFCMFTSVVKAQQQTRRLPSIINHPSLNLSAPYMSADGNALLFISDAGQDGSYTVSYTSREIDWSSPVELPKHLNNRLNFSRGYALSGDGRRIYVTSAKSPAIGGYDIFTSELKGNTWSAPENMMLPINSRSNEACPSITPDGSTIYFMRCDKMDAIKAESCRLFKSSKKSNGQWEEPVELPSHINTGNSQTPRIMADQETLIFSSDKMAGNQGGMDLYVTKLQDGKWSEPVPLDFVNSARDDQYVTANALGRYLIKEAKGTRNNYELTEFLFPAHLRPKGLMKLEGRVSSLDGKGGKAYITLTDLSTNKRIFSGRPQADGSYFFYIPEGSVYEFSVDPEHSEMNYFAKHFDLTSDKIPQKEKLDVELRKPQSGDQFPLDLVKFEANNALDPISYEELKRLARLAKANTDLKFELVLTSETRMLEEIVSDTSENTTLEADSTTQLNEYGGFELAEPSVNPLNEQGENMIAYLVAQGVDRTQVSHSIKSAASEEANTGSLILVKVN